MVRIMVAVVVSSDQVVQLSDAVTLLGDFPALAGVSLEVSKREVVCIEGANGAGKSTILRLCAGLAPLHSGVGMVLGKDLSNRTERRKLRRESGLLAHETFLYDELTVHENIMFWASANRSDVSAINPVLEELGLDTRLQDVKARNLSAGQRRRTALAVMISRRPRLWLLDEPHATLDEAGKDMVDKLIRQAAALGATVLLASHDHDRARMVADRAVTISGGQIELTDPPTFEPEKPGSSTADLGSVVRSDVADIANQAVVSAPLPGRPVTKGFVNSGSPVASRDDITEKAAPLGDLSRSSLDRPPSKSGSNLEPDPLNEEKLE